MVIAAGIITHKIFVGPVYDGCNHVFDYLKIYFWQSNLKRCRYIKHMIKINRARKVQTMTLTLKVIIKFVDTLNSCILFNLTSNT